MIPRSLEFQGYCAVTLLQGPPGFDSILPGRPELVVEFSGKLYAFLDESKMALFMRNPWKYTNQKLPSKLPPRKTEIPMAELPLLGFLESTLYGVLNQALVAVCAEKPKYPFKGMDKSASEYLALYLKGKLWAYWREVC